MKTAPVAFTSNMSDTQINEKRENVFGLISANQIIEISESDKENCTLEDSFIIVSTKDDELTTVCSGEEQQKPVPKELSLTISDKTEKSKRTRSLKRKRNTVDEGQSNTEESLRIERIKQVMEQEQRLAYIKQKHEENISSMKENHLKEIHSLELQHLKNIQTLEVEIKTAQLKAIE